MIPYQVACEQFPTGQLGVVSVIIELPRSNDKRIPQEHGVLCIGSTLACTPHRWAQMQHGRRRRNRRSAVPV